MTGSFEHTTEPRSEPRSAPSAGGLDTPQARAQHFDDLHRAQPDPWNFRSSWYERRKFAITLASLPQQRYAAVWEPGCSIGELTRLLAGRADVVDASDFSATAVRAARAATDGLTGVEVQVSALPSPPPGTGYDLVMLSEVLYYLPPGEREQTMKVVESVVVPGADLVVVHWRHEPGDAWASGASVNNEVSARPGWRAVARHDEPDFVLDVLTRTEGSPDSPSSAGPAHS